MTAPVLSRSSGGFRVDASLRWLLAIFLGGLLLVIGLRVFFAGLQEELRQKSVNERARLFVGEEIVRGIHGIEKDLYRMAATGNPAGVRLVRRSADKSMDKLVHDLGVLKNGGTVRREVLLNLEGRDEMVRAASFTPNPDENTYVMELIEIAPLLEQIRSKADELGALLDRRWEVQEAGDKQRFFDGEQEIAAFLKHIPPFFQRLDENANRLFFDSSERLRALEAQLALQRGRLELVEMGLIALVVILVSLAGMIVARGIGRVNLAREHALDEARAAKVEAERASHAKSEFVSRMSHELRTPLNAIIGFAQLLEAEPMAPSQKQFISLINSSGNHLMELINAVLDHAKIEAGGLTLERIDFDFHATIEAVRSIVLERATSKGLQFVAAIADDLPRRIVGDPTRLRQVLINLLVNAVKFTEQGSVELRIARDEGKLVFSVRDTGIGMDAVALGRLFQPFVQGDDSITRKYGGTGLGLMISKELVEAMGGTIDVESAPEVGTCFWIRLPLQAATSDSETPVTVSAGIGGLIHGRVLLVDDNRVNQQLGVAMLTRLGLEVDVAENGNEALRRIAQTSYALVLMDMEMPELDGISATRQLRHDESLASGSAEEGSSGHLPVIAMTANALAEDRERCFAAGMDGYISKPISLAALEQELARLFGAGKTVESLSLPATMPPADVFDRAEVIRMLGDEELFQELARMYIADAPGYVTELDEALASDDWSRLNRSAHTLKGLFATFAATAAEIDSRQLEQAASTGNGGECLNLAPVVRSHVHALAEALAKS